MFVLVQQPGDVIRAAYHVAVGTWKKRAAVSDGNEARAATRGETRAPTGRAETITKRRDHGADARARRTTDEARFLAASVDTRASKILRRLEKRRRHEKPSA